MTTFRPGDRVHMWQNAWLASTTGTVQGTAADGRIKVRWDSGPGVTPHHPQHLEPAGEPMSKTAIDLTAALELILRHPDGPASSAAIYDRNDDHPEDSIIIEGHVELAQLADEIRKYQAGTTEEAAVKALGILEAAGVKPVDHSNVGCTDGSPEALEEITFWLTGYAKATEAHAKEAADREALEDEALALCIAAASLPAGNGWPPAEPKYLWIKVAEAARKIHGVTK